MRDTAAWTFYFAGALAAGIDHDVVAMLLLVAAIKVALAARSCRLAPSPEDRLPTADCRHIDGASHG